MYLVLNTNVHELYLSHGRLHIKLKPDPNTNTHFQLWCRSDARPHVYVYQDIFAHISCSPIFPNNMSVPTDHQTNY